MIEAHFVHVQVEVKILERYDKAIKIIKISEIKRVENFDKIQTMILQGS